MRAYTYRQDDGTYVKDGCTSFDLEGFLVEQLGFCGCGAPDEALKYVQGGLQLLSDLKELVWTKKIDYKERDTRLRAFFGSVGAEYFFWYRLDDLGLTEHGGQVPGWLTEEGEDMLADLKELYSE